MFFNKLHDAFTINIARTGFKPATPPHMLTEKCPDQTLVLYQHFQRSLLLQRLHRLAGPNISWHRDKGVNMILRDVPVVYLNIFSLADHSDQVPKFLRHLAFQNWLAVFRHPHNIIIEIIEIIKNMARSAIMLHNASMLKPSPKSEGFSPILA